MSNPPVSDSESSVAHAAQEPTAEPAPKQVAPGVVQDLGGAFGDVPMPLEVELDRKVMSIGEILALSPDCVLKMARSAGENIDIRVGGALMAFGEIVILEDTMGVRITDFRGEE